MDKVLSKADYPHAATQFPALDHSASKDCGFVPPGFDLRAEVVVIDLSLAIVLEMGAGGWFKHYQSVT